MVLIIVIVVVALCIQHHKLRTQFHENHAYDRATVKKAAHESIKASKTTTPLYALQQVQRAVIYLETLQDRYGTNVSDITQTDVQDLLDVCRRQEERIIADCARYYPALIPKHPFAGDVGMRSSSDKKRKRNKNEV